MVDKKLLVHALEIMLEVSSQQEIDFHETIKHFKQEIQDGKYDVKVWEYYD